MKLFVNVAASVLLVLLIVAILWPVRSSNGRNAYGGCLSNVKQQALSVLLYGNDDDGRFPLCYNWYTALTPYRQNVDVRCPEVVKDHPGAIGYAYDSRLHRLSFQAIAKPSLQMLIYDSTSLAINTSDPFTSVPIPGRHKGRNMVSYADGHAKAIAFPEVGKMPH